MNKDIEFKFYSLGTLNVIRLYGCENESVTDVILKRMEEIDDHMSAFKELSDISQINLHSGNSFVPVHKDTWEVLNRALWYYRNTNGAFDITIRPLTKLWNINKNNNYISTENLIRSAKEKVNASKLILDSVSVSAKLDIPNGDIDLGGIAKGYAADEVKRIAIEYGISSGLINLGGNIVTFGRKPDKSQWKVGIQHPLAPRGEYLGIITAEDKTIVTSGSYEKFFIKDKIRYHHILDPRTGYPADSNLLSVTAVCDKSIDADALTTSLFVLGFEEGKELLNKIGAEAIFISDNMDIKITNGLIDNFILNRTNDNARRNIYVC